MRARNIVILLVVLAVLVGVFYVYGRAKPGPGPTPTDYVWLFDMEEIEHITIEMPRQTEIKPQSWIKISQGDQFPWFFDDAQHSPVDTNRWGGGIPLLLSGPAANRVIDTGATVEKLTEYGILPTPQILITMLLTDNRTMIIEVGDKTPNTANFYVRAPSTNQVATVDSSWYDVISRLLTEPPYAKATPTPTK